MGRAKKMAACIVLSGVMVLTSVTPAGAQLNPLLDLLLPNAEDEAPPPDPAAPPASEPGPPTQAPVSLPGTESQNAAARPPSSRSVFPLQVPRIPRSPAKNTDTLFANLQEATRRGVPMDAALLQVVAPFPVAGRSNFSHDWGFPRWTPAPHLHEGTDIFADFGTPIVTSEAGRVIKKGTYGAGGISAWVLGDSGNAYYYAHLQSWVRGLAVGQRVERGEIIGFIGDTGNATGGAPHLHFEIHPGTPRRPGGPGSPPRDPKPFLDDALRQAEEQAAVFSRNAGSGGAALVAEAATRYPILVPKTEIDTLIVSATMEKPQDLMWFSMLEPSLGILGLAKHTAADVGLPASELSEQEMADADRMDKVREAVSARTEALQGVAGAVMGEEEEEEPEALIR